MPVCPAREVDARGGDGRETGGVQNRGFLSKFHSLLNHVFLILQAISGPPGGPKNPPRGALVLDFGVQEGPQEVILRQILKNGFQLIVFNKFGSRT